jgi:hypothetical protein
MWFEPQSVHILVSIIPVKVNLLYSKTKDGIDLHRFYLKHSSKLLT